MGVPFTKMHGAGNDFVVVSGRRDDWPALAVSLCRRRRGVGADGLLVALPSERAEVRMRMFNPDGTEDECGNGLRCLALFAFQRGMVSGTEFQVETLSGVKPARVAPEAAGQAQVTVDLGPASLDPRCVPVLIEGERALGVPLALDGEELRIHALSTGTAHTVVFEMPGEERFRRLSPQLEHHPLFPERTSIMWAEIASRERVRIRIWERGVGETLACGTGAAAVAVAAYVDGRTGNRVAVESRGGTLQIDLDAELNIRKTGPAAQVFEGVWPG